MVRYVFICVNLANVPYTNSYVGVSNHPLDRLTALNEDSGNIYPHVFKGNWRFLIIVGVNQSGNIQAIVEQKRRVNQQLSTLIDIAVQNNFVYFINAALINDNIISTPSIATALSHLATHQPHTRWTHVQRTSIKRVGKHVRSSISRQQNQLRTAPARHVQSQRDMGVFTPHHSSEHVVRQACNF